MTKFLTTVTLFAIPLTLAISAMPASALNSYLLQASFAQQGGFFSGTFDYDSDSNTLSNVDITTPNFESFNPFVYKTGFTQNFSASAVGNTNFKFEGSGQGTVVNKPPANPGSTLNFETLTPLLNILLPGSVTLIKPGVTSFEVQGINTGFVNREFTGGTITNIVPVPFEFNPAVGVVLLGLGFGVSKIKNKVAKKLA